MITKSRPILFSKDMVLAILRGQKTQTRRVLKRQPDCEGALLLTPPGELWYTWPYRESEYYCKCPYGKPGDLLWVRETWREILPGFAKSPKNVIYAADGEALHTCHWESLTDEFVSNGEKWTPSIFMPRWASKITLRITNVDVQRLQDITPDDAFCEGVDPIITAAEPSCLPPYRELWDSLNAKRGFGWTTNPYVWKIVFERITA